jgi:hypothetical protein
MRGCGAVLLAMICIGVLMVTCNLVPTDVPNSISSWTYALSHDTLIVSHSAFTATRCDDTGKVTDVAAAYMDTSVVTFSGNGNTMTVVAAAGDTNAVLVRIGSGIGIQGQWQVASEDSIETTMQITANAITESLCYADAFMAYEAPSYTAPNYSITAAKLSCSSARLTGTTSGEVVTVSFGNVGALDNPGADLNFTSSNTAHAPFTIYANPATCPNDYAAWFNAFLDANPSVAKRAVTASSATATELRKRMALLKKKLMIF